jgi:hypothetical protein
LQSTLHLARLVLEQRLKSRCGGGHVAEDDARLRAAIGEALRGSVASATFG